MIIPTPLPHEITLSELLPKPIEPPQKKNSISFFHNSLTRRRTLRALQAWLGLQLSLKSMLSRYIQNRLPNGQDNRSSLKLSRCIQHRLPNWKDKRSSLKLSKWIQHRLPNAQEIVLLRSRSRIKTYTGRKTKTIILIINQTMYGCCLRDASPSLPCWGLVGARI